MNFESEKKKNSDRYEHLENELIKIKFAKNPNKFQSELKELNKIQVVDKDIHEIKNEIL